MARAVAPLRDVDLILVPRNTKEGASKRRAGLWLSNCRRAGGSRGGTNERMKGEGGLPLMLSSPMRQTSAFAPPLEAVQSLGIEVCKARALRGDRAECTTWLCLELTARQQLLDKERAAALDLASLARSPVV